MILLEITESKITVKIFVKDYGFLSFVKNKGTNIGKNESKSPSGKYRQKFIYNTKQSTRDALKTVRKRRIQKIAEKTGDLVGNKIANKITKIAKTSQQINSETVTNERDKETKKDKYLQNKDR